MRRRAMSMATASASAAVPSNLEMRLGDLLDAHDVQYIAHQVNCVMSSGACSARSLCGQIFSRFPHADMYAKEHTGGRRSEPGTISVYGVVNLHAQLYPGRSSYSNDSAAHRLQWFERRLALVGNLPGLTSIAMPTEVGCGMGGGDGTLYRGENHCLCAGPS